MKVSAYIFALSIVLLFGALHIQPLFNDYTIKKVQTCSRSKCPKQSPAKEGKNTNNGCNPFVPCSIGSCCYVIESFFIYSSGTAAIGKKIAPVDDNRLLHSSSACWHPPEMIS